MEFRFELPQGYSNYDLIALNKLVHRKSKLWRWLVPLLRLCAVWVGVGFLLTALSFLDGGYAGDSPVWALVIPPLAIGLLWLALGVFCYRITAWSSRRATLRVRSITTILDAEGIAEQTEKGTAQYRYDALAAIYAYQGRWFLFLDKHHAFILPGQAMTAGDPQLFTAFLEEKTGKTVVTIKSRRSYK